MQNDPANLLREHGVQVTAQRLAVLRAVSGRPHCTADDIAEDVRAEIGAISRQAVYDALAMLADKCLIRRIQPDGSAALYEDRVGDNHHHVICRACGKTVDVDCAVGDTPCLTAADDSGYQIDEAEVIFWGTLSRMSGDDSSRGRRLKTANKRHFETRPTNFQSISVKTKGEFTCRKMETEVNAPFWVGLIITLPGRRRINTGGRLS